MALADEPLLVAVEPPNVINYSPATVTTVIEELPSAGLSIKEIDLWSRIRNGYAIPNLDNQFVTQQITWYSTRTDYIQRTIQRGSRYLFHVVEELEKRGMPTELALLPFIESAFNPQAISTAKASGMWQFMAATGHDFNLKQNIFKDDRRGVLDSTDAALTYLERLYGIFGDWQLALAAYNWGEGSVQRAIKKQQALGLPIDFDSLSALMPNETKNYLPKLQAVKNIIGHPEQFNIALPKLNNLPYFVSIEKIRDIDVRVAAQLAELSVVEFTALNPQFNRPVITGSNNTKILLPTDNAVLFKENLSKWHGPLSTWSTHLVNKTERIESLASRLGFKPEFIREANLIPAKMMVKSGSTLLIPKTKKSPDQDISAEIAEKGQLVIEKGFSDIKQIHIKVSKNENLNTIAKRYKVSIVELKNWNNLKRDTVTVGQRLQLQVPVIHARNKSNKITANHTSRVNHKINRNSKAIVAHAKTGKRPQG
ncbi:MAG: transglycosylase SLT domain-containing protein [Cytophaga sp.]|nr:transglycosylase SLT domain-containing protein [Undibacterium sp.]